MVTALFTNITGVRRDPEATFHPFMSFSKTIVAEQRWLGSSSSLSLFRKKKKKISGDVWAEWNSDRNFWKCIGSSLLSAELEGNGCLFPWENYLPRWRKVHGCDRKSFSREENLSCKVKFSGWFSQWESFIQWNIDTWTFTNRWKRLGCPDADVSISDV